MASTADPLLKMELMANGENSSAWGTKTNTNLGMIATAIAGKEPVVVSSGDTTLADIDYVADTAKAMALDVTGAMSAACKIVIPARSKMYIVRRATSGAYALTIGTSAGTAATLNSASAISIVWSDGTDTFVIASTASGTVDADTLGGVAAALYARLDTAQSFSKGQAVSFVTLSDGPTVTMDCTLSNNFIVTLGGARTLSISNATDGQTITLLVVQDSTGGRTLAMPAAVLFPNAVAPSWTPSGDGVDLVRMTYNSAAAKWYAEFNQSISAPAGGTTNITLESNEQCVDIYARAGSPAGATTVNVTVAAGVVISSDSTAQPAMDTEGFASSSVIRIYNYGTIMGKGGRGSDGNWVHDSGDADAATGGAAGEAGGTALRGPGASCDLIVYNASGKIWGGGGGGGAGGVSSDDNGIAVSGGGGGGAGAGLGGSGVGGKRRGNVNAGLSTSGANGTRSITSAAGGAAGTGASGGTGAYSVSGAGGDFGAAGTNGTANTTGTSMQQAATNGGAAGLAIDLDGGTLDGASTGTSNPNVKGAIS
jgi:hypothetical protein